MNIERGVKLEDTFENRIVYKSREESGFGFKEDHPVGYSIINYIVDNDGNRHFDEAWKWDGKAWIAFQEKDSGIFFAGDAPICITLETIEENQAREYGYLAKIYDDRDNKIWEKVENSRNKKLEGSDHTNIKDIEELKERIRKYVKFIGRDINEDKLNGGGLKDLTLLLLRFREFAQFPLDY